MPDSHLTLAQEFSLHTYKDSIQRLSHEDALDALIEIIRQSMVKDNLMKDFISAKLAGEWQAITVVTERKTAMEMLPSDLLERAYQVADSLNISIESLIENAVRGYVHKHG